MVLQRLMKAWASLVLMLAIAASLTAAFAAQASGLSTAIMALLGAVLVGAAVKGLGRFQPSDRAAALILFACVLAIVCWTLTFNSGQVSDFGIYYRCGIASGHDLSAWLDRCQSAYLAENSTYWKRSLFYSSPIAWLFGDGYRAFKGANAALHALTLLAWFLGVRRFYGNGVASAAMVLLCLYPEFWFAITLITPDNATVLCVALFLLSLAGLTEIRTGMLMAATAIGILIFLGDMLRSIGLILIITLLMYAISIASPHQRFKTIGMAAVSAAVALLANRIFLQIYPTCLPDLFDFLKLLSAIDFHTTQEFNTNYAWAEHFWAATPDSLKQANALYKVCSEIYGGFAEWPLYLFKKAVVLFSGIGYYNLSAIAYPNNNPDSWVSTVVSDVPFSLALYPVLALIVAAMLVLALVGIWRSRVHGLAWACLTLLLVFAGLVLGVGEVQPRYSVVIAPAIALLGALAIYPGADQVARIDLTRSLMTGTVVLASLYLAGLGVSRFLPSPARLNHGVMLATPAEPLALRCNNTGVTLAANYKTIRLTWEAGSTCAVLAIPIDSGKSRLGFYLSGAQYPYRFEPPHTSSIAYRIYAGSTEIKMGELGTRPVIWAEVDHLQAAPPTIYLLLTRQAKIAPEYTDLTLMRNW